ncbi:MAG: peptidoglycan-associated lipoprotein Pal [Candidatus Solibacter usitatus]|nr:peptidoglycan-associated lipoprotein Pal [Candidatus Solibacter usitatus]
MPRTSNRALVNGVVALLVVVAAACSRPKAVVAPEVSPAAESAQPTDGRDRDGTTQVQSEPTISAAGVPEEAVSATDLPADIEALNRAGYLKDAFFETDKSDLREDTRATLAADAAWLKAHPTVKVTIEGHCDERNTAEYNLALGWRRANAAKAYLASLGVAAERISTISYGEEKPFALGRDEGSWSQNRRAHFVVTSK